MRRQSQLHPCGAGVALKVVQAVGSRFGKPNLWRELIDLAMLGTVADLMPMRSQNRAMVGAGVRMINENPRPCIAALLGESGFADNPVSSSSLSFTIIPRLNAAGRMGNAQLALDLLMCDDFAEACHLSAELENVNTQRRTIEAELAEVASEQAERVSLKASVPWWLLARAGTRASKALLPRALPTVMAFPPFYSPSKGTKPMVLAVALVTLTCSRQFPRVRTSLRVSAGTTLLWALRCPLLSFPSFRNACAPTWTSFRPKISFPH